MGDKLKIIASLSPHSHRWAPSLVEVEFAPVRPGGIAVGAQAWLGCAAVGCDCSWERSHGGVGMAVGAYER